MTPKILPIPLIEIQREGGLTYRKFEMAMITANQRGDNLRLKRQQLKLLFMQIRGIGDKTASAIVTYIYSLPQEKRKELVRLLREGDN